MPSRFWSVTTKGFETLHCCNIDRSCVCAVPRPSATIRGRKAVALAILRAARPCSGGIAAICELWHGCSCSAVHAAVELDCTGLHSTAARVQKARCRRQSANGASLWPQPRRCFAIGSPSVLQAASSFCKFWIWIDSRAKRRVLRASADDARARPTRGRALQSQGFGSELRRNNGGASGDPRDYDSCPRCCSGTSGTKRGCNRPSGDGCCQYNRKPPSSRPERRDVPFHDRTRAREAARAAPGRGPVQGRREPPRGGHLETRPRADALRLLRQGELSERRPLPLRPRESGRCTRRVPAKRQRGSTRFSAEAAVRRRHLSLLRARAVSQRRELSVFPRRDEGVGPGARFVRRNLVTAKTVRNGRTTDVRSRCRMCGHGKDA